MSKMGKTGLLAMALVMVTAPAVAGQGRSGGGGPGRDGEAGRRGPMGPNLERVVTVAMENRGDLDLTDAQVAELQAVLDEFKGVSAAAAESREKALEQLRSGEVTREEMRERRSNESAAFREVAQQYHQRLDGIMSQAQRDQLHGIMMRNMRERRGTDRPGNRPGGRQARRGPGR